MRDIDETFQSLGYAATQKRLYSLGFTKRQIADAVQSGALQRVNRAWLAHPSANPSTVTALESGGVLGGASALRSQQIWVSEPRGVVEVCTKPNRPVVQREGVKRLWRDVRSDARHEWRVTVTDALLQYLPRTTRLDGIATLDSALHGRHVTRRDFAALQAKLPERCRMWLRHVDARSESGTESIVRVSGQDRGWQMEPQVSFEGGRLDLVIDGWLCVECDSREWHSDARQIEKDLDRTLRLLRAGGRPIRLTYAAVMHNLDSTMQELSEILAKGHPTRLRL